MAFGPTSVAALSGSGGPKPGVTTRSTDLLAGDLRESLGLGAVSTKKAKQTLDGTPNGLGKDDFLKLLLAQLSNQDPLKPLEDKEFIAQLAQFNTLEQMQQANKHLVDMLTTQSLSQASALIGRQVETAGSKDGGVVAGVRVVNSQPMLVVGDYLVALNDVISVAAPADDDDTTHMTTGTTGTTSTSTTGSTTGASTGTTTGASTGTVTSSIAGTSTTGTTTAGTTTTTTTTP